MTQLNEILEDDDKLTKMVQDMEEVRAARVRSSLPFLGHCVFPQPFVVFPNTGSVQ